jgi:hypothetical protein
MSISGFIHKTKGKILARQENVRVQREQNLEELRVKNAKLRDEMKTREEINKIKTENRKLKMQRLTSNLPNFGGGNAGNKKAKVSTGLGSPFGGGFGGNSPFSAKNLAKDSFGKDRTATGLKLGNSPFSNAFAGESKKITPRMKKKNKGDTTIIIRR